MSFDSLFFIKDIIIALLIFALIATIKKIQELKATLEQEKRKRSMPLINMEVDTEDDKGVLWSKGKFPFILSTELSLMYKQDGKGIDPDHCRMLFWLEMKHLKDVAVDVHIQNRIVSLMDAQTQPLKRKGFLILRLKI